ncbi:MAG: hypothetical protein Q9188_003247 [Gyalolechia gomerana]
MLLTSGQISMVMSSSVGEATECDEKLGLIGMLMNPSLYLHQQTVRSLQAAIKPQPVAPPPPSPVLAKHFGTPPGHSFFDKYLSSNRPKGGWAKVAYVQLLREHIHVCNALMLFAVLEDQESMAQRMILYPRGWDKQVPGQKALDSQVDTSKRLLREAAKRYKVMLQPVDPLLKVQEGESIFPLVGLLSLSAYNRIIYLPPSGLVLDTSGLDHLFTLPMESDMLGISAGPEDEGSSPSIVLLSPSKESFQATLSSLDSEKYDEDISLRKTPLLADLPKDQVHVVAKTSGLRFEDDKFDAAGFMDNTSYVQISDANILGPEYDTPRQLLASARPEKPEPKKAWLEVYEKYRERRMDVCGLDLEPAPNKLKYLLPAKSSKSPTVSKQEDVPYFDSSIQINPDLIKTHACEQAIGYQFREPLLLWEALQVPSALVHMPRYAEGNKRLAIVGDMILDLLLALKWYPSWTNRSVFSTLRFDVTSNDSLERMGKINKLERYMTCPSGSNSLAQKTMTATVEAIVGAAYLDGGMNAAETVVQNLGINALEGTIPKASFNIRTRWAYVPESPTTTVAPSRKQLRKRR